MVITRAAVVFSNGGVVEGHDYASIIVTAHKLGYSGNRTYGFLTSGGDFVLPSEASEIALKSKQITERNDDLQPEDLFPSLPVFMEI